MKLNAKWQSPLRVDGTARKAAIKLDWRAWAVRIPRKLRDSKAKLQKGMAVNHHTPQEKIVLCGKEMPLVMGLSMTGYEDGRESLNVAPGVAQLKGGYIGQTKTTLTAEFWQTILFFACLVISNLIIPIMGW